MNREISKKMKAAKEEWAEEQCKNIEKGMMPGNSKETYKTSRLSPRSNSIGRQSLKTAGNILMECTAVLNRSTEYRSGPYNYEFHPDTRQL